MKKLINKIDECKNRDELEVLRIAVLGKKGELAKAFAEMKNLSGDEKRERAKELNDFKEIFSAKFEKKEVEISEAELDEKMFREKIDISLISPKNELGGYHPVVETINRIIEYFLKLNFAIEEGNMIEDDWHNFEALNYQKVIQLEICKILFILMMENYYELILHQFKLEQ